MSSKTYGYIRVSTLTQRDDRQWIAMENFGIPKICIFADKQSGKDFNRPAYNQMLSILQPGDTIVIKSLDRLGRNFDELIIRLDLTTREKSTLYSLTCPLLSGKSTYYLGHTE